MIPVLVAVMVAACVVGTRAAFRMGLHPAVRPLFVAAPAAALLWALAAFISARYT